MLKPILQTKWAVIASQLTASWAKQGTTQVCGQWTSTSAWSPGVHI
jgi:hypothetical protein